VAGAQPGVQASVVLQWQVHGVSRRSQVGVLTAAGDEYDAGVTTRYDRSTALVVVDVQNDFADPAGSLYVRDGESVIDVANTEIEAARRARALIVYTMDWHPPSTPHFAKDGGIWPVHCVAETWGRTATPGSP
jgi:hypothetical protein